MPIFPELIILMASVPPLLPTLNLIKSVEPTPEVERSSREEPAAVPPMTRGTVSEVAVVTVPVKLAEEEMVWPLISPEVMAPELKFKLAPVATPMFGVTKVGVLAKTNAPVPVSSVIAESKLAEDGVARSVAMPVPSPDTPVEMGSPVALVKVTDVGVPKIGVTKVGEVANTRAPVPVSSEITPAS